MEKIETWTVAFVGKGEVTEANVKQLLDKQLLPANADVQALLPLTIPRRGSKGLRAVDTLLHEEWDIPAENMDPDDMVAHLAAAKDEGDTVVMVLIGVDEFTSPLAEAALDANIEVKDLCSALDDVVFEPEAEAEAPAEPDPPRRGRGRPRKDATVEAEVAGPATVNEGPADTDATDLLRAVIRQLIREELSMYPGVHAYGVQDEPAEPAEEKTVRAFVNTDGEYRRATKRSRARENEEEVMLTESEANAAGISS